MVNNFDIDYPSRLGIPPGFITEATIVKDNGNGTVVIKLNKGGNAQTQNSYNANLPTSWAGPSGQFMGGAPVVGSSVLVSQGAGGKWYIVSYIKSDRTFDEEFVTRKTTQMSALTQGRALIQVSDDNRLLVDPNSGTQIGSGEDFIHIDPVKKILSNNFDENMSFTEASHHIDGLVKRNLLGSTNVNPLETRYSHNFDRFLFTIPMDPSASASSATSNTVFRNLPLVENRTVYYELAHSYDPTSDDNEAKLVKDPTTGDPDRISSRREMRSDVLSLSPEFPNHLIEIIRGTCVDAFGNIIDLNRYSLPIGKVDSLILSKSDDIENAYRKIREQMRKSIAYHFEINARKEQDLTVLPGDTKTDYQRSRSRFFIDIDKEGQFKINVPLSSETGNVPILTRHENFSTLYAREESNKASPNDYVRSDISAEELNLSSFGFQGGVTLTGEDEDLLWYESPNDRITDEPMLYRTAHHDILNTCEFHTVNSPRLPEPGQVDPATDEDNRLNNEEHFKPYETLVSDEIIVSGEGANAGGRSGSINLDGFLSVNIGANTIDRQSLWLDYAGGVLANVGRDKQGISYAANMDGDFLLQVGGPGIGNEADSRFADQNDAVRDGVVDVRVIANNGQQVIFRMSTKGIDIYSPAGLNITAQQDINIKTNGRINMAAEIITAYADTTKRKISRYPDGEDIT
jgi:hypothetical protein